MAAQPKPAFFVAVGVVVLVLVVFAGYQARHLIFPKNDNPQNKPIAIDPTKLGGGGGDDRKGKAEAPDADSITTVKEYPFKPSERLPPVKGTAAYKPMEDKTVKFALNVWAGWAPIIFANDGF